ncbi:uncharacterized protein RSE6_09918 [Rhynchosporium secalis]|uniref:Uncharacterized protein n=1 Tax=Rhynchosporium secalis TaxID=38038 RepID=A0A1E1MJ87_RHYSE|nr:uncharacterized protein RSE6_09918 [Rhynchosporium secalis]
MFHSYQAVNTTAQPKPPVRWVSAGATLLPLYAFTLSVAMQSAQIYNQVSETDASPIPRKHRYTLNRFDVIHEDGNQPVVVMQSSQRVNGGGEVKEDWKSGECLYFYQRL